MKEKLALLCTILISAIAFSCVCHAMDKSSLDRENSDFIKDHPSDQNNHTPSGSDLWNFIKGQPAVDSLQLGMWSLHVDGSGDIFGSGKNNEHNYLIGLQYKGFNTATFINSHDDRAYTIGLSREVFSHQLSPDLRFDAGYKIGLLYGYKDNLPNLNGLSGYVMPVFGFSWKRVGFDIGMVPIGVLTFNFRINLN